MNATEPGLRVEKVISLTLFADGTIDCGSFAPTQGKERLWGEGESRDAKQLNREEAIEFINEELGPVNLKFFGTQLAHTRRVLRRALGKSGRHD